MRIATLLILLFGCAASLAFFAWVERNCTLPILPIELHWPWLHLPENVVLRAAFDCALIVAFGALHSTAAQESFHARALAWLPRQSLRAAYVTATGLALIGVMGLWQHTGILIWILPAPFRVLNLASLILFWGIFSSAGLILKRFDTMEFLGFKQIYESGSPSTRTQTELFATGIYGRVRHPIYTITLAAFVLAPMMSLDRLCVIAGSLIYLLGFGIRIEERKLIEIFGEKYLNYRKQVPAIFPKLFATGGKPSL